MGSKRRARQYFRIDYTARIVPSGQVYRPNAVFVTGSYRTPEGAIRGLRAIMIRDARVQGISGRVDVEIHRLAQSSEDEYYAELSLAMHAFQQHAYRAPRRPPRRSRELTHFCSRKKDHLENTILT